MTPQEKFDALVGTLRTEADSLKKLPAFVTQLIADPDLKVKVAKDVEYMEDKILFFYQGEVLFSLGLPWNINLPTTRHSLTEKFKYLLEEKPNE